MTTAFLSTGRVRPSVALRRDPLDQRKSPDSCNACSPLDPACCSSSLCKIGDEWNLNWLIDLTTECLAMQCRLVLD